MNDQEKLSKCLAFIKESANAQIKKPWYIDNPDYMGNEDDAVEMGERISDYWRGEAARDLLTEIGETP